AAIEQFDLLHQLFGSVIVPEAVRNEFLADRTRVSQRSPLLTRSWLEIREPVHQEEVFHPRLGAGETQALALALELSADLLLIDEALGRVVARKLGIQVTGLLGILRQAKLRALIPAVAPLVSRLRCDFGFHLDERLVSDVLKSVGETYQSP
ncbi:MAG: DUF3368 domain-containing protein, partial [Verrucomicrobiaceae bacterium]